MWVTCHASPKTSEERCGPSHIGHHRPYKDAERAINKFNVAFTFASAATGATGGAPPGLKGSSWSRKVFALTVACPVLATGLVGYAWMTIINNHQYVA